MTVGLACICHWCSLEYPFLCTTLEALTTYQVFVHNQLCWKLPTSLLPLFVAIKPFSILIVMANIYMGYIFFSLSFS